jgi:hypothetical protein
MPFNSTALASPASTRSRQRDFTLEHHPWIARYLDERMRKRAIAELQQTREKIGVTDHVGVEVLRKDVCNHAYDSPVRACLLQRFEIGSEGS